MPGFSLSLNSKPLLNVATDNLEILDVSVRGDLGNPGVSYIEVRGSGYAQDKSNSHLIWLHEKAMRSDDELSVEFVDNVESPEVGKDSRELYNDDNASPTLSGAEGQGLEEPALSILGADSEPTLGQGNDPHARLHFKIDSSCNAPIEAHSKDEDSHLFFHVVWNWKNPVHAQVLLHTHTIDTIRNFKPGNEHANFTIPVGNKLKFRRW